MKILLKLFDYLLNPSKRIRHILKPKNKKDDLDYLLKKKTNSLKSQNKIISESNIATVTYRSVSIKFFMVAIITFLTTLIIFLKFDSIDNIFKFIKKYNLPDFETPGAENYQKQLVFDYLYFSPLVILLFGAILWTIGFYLYEPFLKFATFILSFCMGYFIGMFFVLFNLYSFLKIFMPSIFITTFLSTIFVIVLTSYLYYDKKFLVTSKVRNFTMKFCVLTYFIGLFMILLHTKTLNPILILISRKNSWFLLYLIIIFLLNIAQLIVGILMWVLILNNIDLFIEQKIPKKYEWTLISVLLISLIQIFMSIFRIIVIIIRMLKLNDKKN